MSCFKRRLKLGDWKQDVIDVTPFLCHAHISTIVKSPPATEAAVGDDDTKDAEVVETPVKPKEAAGGEETVETVEGVEPKTTHKTTGSGSPASHLSYVPTGKFVTLNDAKYSLGMSWTLQDGTEGKVGCIVKTKHHPKRSYVCLIILQSAATEEQYIACCLLPSCERQLHVRHAVFPLKDIVSAETTETPAFDQKVFTELGDKFFKKPTEVDSMYAKAFELKKRSRAKKVPIIRLESSGSEESEEEEETAVNPPAKKRKLKAATPVGKTKPKDGESFFVCTLICGNGKKCGKRFPTRVGLGNHKRTHKKTPKSAKPKKTANGQVRYAHELKLTVTMEAYKAMTASVGMYGHKLDEIRSAGKAWVESRLDGRKYDYVKLYGGVPGFYEIAPWTRFHCLGYSKAGAAGESYRVQGMGTGQGWEMWYQGEVWEIHLGVVVERHYGAQEDRDLQLGLPRPDFDDDFGNDFDDFDAPVPANTGGRSGKAEAKHGNQLADTATPSQSSAVSSGVSDLSSCKGYADIFTSIQKGPMDILKQMMLMQAEKNKSDNTNRYSIEQMTSMKGMFNG
jgi:hypothetical protein